MDRRAVKYCRAAPQRRHTGRHGAGQRALALIPDFIRSGPCRKAKYAWLCYAKDNEAARRMCAGFGYEEVPEACDGDDGEMPAVLKL